MKAQATTLYPFVPSGSDFDRAIAFFAELGFAEEWQREGFAGLRFGGAYFMLQKIDVPEWQKNQMITYEVDDLEAYWSEIRARDLPARFPGVRTRPPTDYPWGREIHIVDPAGVGWHVRQARAAA
jgi:predicted enzyme related to lactoylglutathione lyase